MSNKSTKSQSSDLQSSPLLVIDVLRTFIVKLEGKMTLVESEGDVTLIVALHSWCEGIAILSVLLGAFLEISRDSHVQLGLTKKWTSKSMDKQYNVSVKREAAMQGMVIPVPRASDHDGWQQKESLIFLWWPSNVLEVNDWNTFAPQIIC